jgi:hypothetical protein
LWDIFSANIAQVFRLRAFLSAHPAHLNMPSQFSQDIFAPLFPKVDEV